MSKVISFRLDEKNPREAQALKVIEAWASRGYSLRYILVEALLALADKNEQNDGVSSALEELMKMLRNLQVASDLLDERSQDKRLTDEFINVIAKAKRPGLRVE